VHRQRALHGLILTPRLRSPSAAWFRIAEFVRFLSLQPGWELVADLGKALIFHKLTGEASMPGWWEQPYMTEKISASPAAKRFRSIAMTRFWKEMRSIAAWIIVAMLAWLIVAAVWFVWFEGT
jgi:hypothetical protein